VTGQTKLKRLELAIANYSAMIRTLARRGAIQQPRSYGLDE
jgi:hypothetical protein